MLLHPALDHEELTLAIRRMDPSAPASTVDEMIAFADENGDQQCVHPAVLPQPSSLCPALPPLIAHRHRRNQD